MSLILITFVSCSYVNTYKTVKIRIDNIHPFEKVMNKSLWYTLYWNDERGNTQYLHINSDTREVSVKVRKDYNVYFCASLMDVFQPLGGVVNPGGCNELSLSFKEGYLVDFLIDLSKKNNEAVSLINYPLLLDSLESKRLLHDFDKLSLAKAILEGSSFLDNIYYLPAIKVDLDSVFPGYWVSDYPIEGAIYVSPNMASSVSLSLCEGVHNYLSYDREYYFTVVVDTRNRKYFVNMKKWKDLK